MIPVYGTYKEFQDLYNNPSWSQAGWAALSALGDLSMLVPLVGPAAKASLTAAKAANTIGKAAKLNKAQRVVPLLQETQKAGKAALVKTGEDVTWPVLYSTMARPTGVAVTYPYRD